MSWGAILFWWVWLSVPVALVFGAVAAAGEDERGAGFMAPSSPGQGVGVIRNQSGKGTQ